MGERSFGEKIAQLRNKKGWTIREFAKRIMKEDGEPMSPSYLCDIEQGRRKPPALEVIRRMAELLDADFDDLMVSAHRTPPDIKQLVQENKMLRRVLKRAKDTGFKDWKEVEKLIENWTGRLAQSQQRGTDRTD
ncbi:MAG: helix-turn-helix domain-containing protein [candidate division Zixibacteria bacterium]|nr:helix-turn-helix domain-containing protein [candidate division Zixibacteria bacterium]